MQRKQNVSSLLCISLIVICLCNVQVRGEDYFVHEIIDCITKEKCIPQYRLCAVDEDCSAIINAQSGCRVQAQCNQNSKFIWDPICYINCIQDTDNLLYLALTECSRNSCHAYSTLLKPLLYLMIALFGILSLL